MTRLHVHVAPGDRARRRRLSAVLLAIGLGAGAGPVAGQTAIDFAGPPGSSKPSLSASPTGRLLLTWLEALTEGRWALRVAARDGRWSEPRTVVESDRLFVNWADFPSAVETATGAWVVHWLETTEAKPYAYHVRLARTLDQGRTWSAPMTAHTDRSATEHGFAAMVPNDDGSVAIAWLDGGAMATDTAGGMSVRTATLKVDGTIGAEIQLDGRTCECCQVAMARGSAGLVAVYRDRSADEVRDIAIVHETGGRWSRPAIVSPDNWVWRACPVNGPSIDAVEQRVGVAWFTAPGGKTLVRAALSADGGHRFQRPATVSDANPLGRVQIRLTDDGAVVVWLEAEGDRAEWRARFVGPTGLLGRPVELGVTERTRHAGFARAVIVGADLFLAWTDPVENGRVVVRRLPVAALPRH